MSTPDRAFFAAYTSDTTFVFGPGTVPAPPSPAATAAPAAARPSAASPAGKVAAARVPAPKAPAPQAPAPQAPAPKAAAPKAPAPKLPAPEAPAPTGPAAGSAAARAPAAKAPALRESTTSGQVPAQPAAPPPAAPASTRGAGAASPAAHHRVDRQHAAAPRPHAPATRVPQELLQTETFEACYFASDDELLQTSCLVVAPTPLPPLPAEPRAPAAPIPPAAAPLHTAIHDVPEEDPPAAIPEPHDNTPEIPRDPGPQLATAKPWKPVWELDEFSWPLEASQLYESQAEYFSYAGGKLLDASREGLKVLAVVGTRAGEGGTTLVTCLARAVAAAGAKVALFDANLTNPELGPKLGLDFSRGWQDALDAPETLDESAVYSLQDGVTLFPLAVPHHVTALDDDRVSRILREASAHFDLLLVDAGTVPAGDATLFEAGESCPVSAVMIVRDVRRTTETETLVTASRLRSLGIEAIGIAENFCHHSATRAAAA